MNYIFPTEELIQELTIQSQQKLGSKSDFLKSLGEPFHQLTRGTETQEVYHAQENVYKFYQMDADRLKHIALHNFLFDKTTPYTVLGTLQEGVLVVKQPFIEAVNNSSDEARLQLKDDLVKRFGTNSLEISFHEKSQYWGKLEGDWYIHPCKIALDDLKNSNIFIDRKTTVYAVIDCIIHAESYSRWHSKITQNSFGCKRQSF